MSNLVLLTWGLIAFFCEWEKGFLIITVCGFAQDPIRKIISGQPVILTISVVVYLIFFFFKLKFERFSPPFLAPFKKQQNLEVVVSLYVFYVVIQAFLGFFTYQSLAMLIIGLLSYLIPLPILWITWYANKKISIISTQLKLYVIFAIIVAFSIFLSYFNFNLLILKPVGDGMLISSDYGPLISYSGLMRSGEIATWHLATSICIIIGYLIYLNHVSLYIKFLPIIAVMFTAGLLTGRRKFVAEIIAFICFYIICLFFLEKGKKVNNVYQFILLIAGVVGFTFLFFQNFTSNIDDFVDPGLQPYLIRSQSVIGDDRFSSLGINSIFWAINRFGYFGIGAGTAGLGMAHFGGTAQGASGAGEAGLGKIVVELGIPGLIIIIYLLFKLLLVFWENLKIAFLVKYENFSCLNLICFSLFLANIPMFITSSLLFGDPFVLVMIGFFMGNILGIKRALTLNQIDISII